MWVSWVVARQLVVGLLLLALAFAGLRAHALPALRAVPGLNVVDDPRAYLVGRLLRILVLALALWVAIEMLDLRGPDPKVPRHILDVPSEHERGPKGCAPFC